MRRPCCRRRRRLHRRCLRRGRKRRRRLRRRDRTIASCYSVVARYGYTDAVNHGDAFMEQLVTALLRHLLERRGVGSAGAAQRLLAALQARASALAAAAGASSAMPGACASIAETLAAVAAAVAAAHTSCASRGCAVTALLQGLTAADALAILHGCPGVDASGGPCSRRPSVFAAKGRAGSSGGGAALEAAARARGGSSSGGGGEVLACITLLSAGSVGTKQAPLASASACDPDSPRKPSVLEPAASVEDAAEAAALAPPTAAAAAAADVPAAAAVTDAPSFVARMSRLSLRSLSRRRSAGHTQEQQGGEAAARAAGDSGDDDADLPIPRVPSYFGELRRLHEDEAGSSAAAPAADGGAAAAGAAADHGGNGLGGEPGGATAPPPDVPELSPAQVLALHEAATLLGGYATRWVHCVGRTQLKVAPARGWGVKLLGAVFQALSDNTKPVTSAWGIPAQHLVELGMDVEV